MAYLDVDAALLVSPRAVTMNVVGVRVQQFRKIGAERLENVLTKLVERQLGHKGAHRSAGLRSRRDPFVGHSIEQDLSFHAEHLGDPGNHGPTRT